MACQSPGWPAAAAVKTRCRCVGREWGPDYACSFELDATKTPKWIDFWRVGWGDHSIPTWDRYEGVYVLDGDSLTICESPFGAARPTAFSAKPGDGRTLTVLKRVATKGGKGPK